MQFTIAFTLLAGLGAFALPHGQIEHSGHGNPNERRSVTLNKFLGLVLQLFPVNVAVRDVVGPVTGAEATLATVAGIGTTEDNLGNATCLTIAIIWARGTSESGNVGALVGPLFFVVVREHMASSQTLAAQGVEYPADVAGFLDGGDAGGSQAM